MPALTACIAADRAARGGAGSVERRTAEMDAVDRESAELRVNVGPMRKDPQQHNLLT
jgi:hypothetical protein